MTSPQLRHVSTKRRVNEWWRYLQVPILSVGGAEGTIGVIETGSDDERDIEFTVSAGKAEGILPAVAEDISTSLAEVGVLGSNMSSVVVVLSRYQLGDSTISFSQYEPRGDEPTGSWASSSPCTRQGR